MEILRRSIAEELARRSGFQQAGLTAERIQNELARPPKAEMGDVAMGCFRLAKEAACRPNELAAKLVAGDIEEAGLVASCEAAGPYLNLRLNRASVIRRVLEAIEGQSPGSDPRGWRFGDSQTGKGKTLVIDFSSPNIAKPLAVHHLRSTMIGYAIKRIRESQGWRVVGINHLGDWGTGFGKLIAGLKRYRPEITLRAAEGDDKPLGDLSVRELNQAYQRVSEEAKSNPELEEAARQEFAVLERYMEALVADSAHEAAAEGVVNFRIWRHAREISLAEFERIYHALGLRFHVWPVVDIEAGKVLTEEPDAFYGDFGVYVGESYYVAAEDLCRRIVADAVDSKIAEESEGALVVFTHGAKKPPMILVKADGATSYHTRDMAAALYRKRHWKADEMAYVVGGEQKLHFEQLFQGLTMLGHEWGAACRHVDFGLLLFKQPDGKWAKATTRGGRVIYLEDLIDETTGSVREIIREKNAELAADARHAEETARAVGVGAVVFNDLKNARRNNIKFDWDEVLNFQGETGPYMQMQFVRMGSVAEKYAERYGRFAPGQRDAELLARDDEFGLAMLLADFPAAVARASDEMEPSVVARALIDVASATSSWWTATKDTRIVGDDADLSRARVRLVNAVRKVLGRGLTLLAVPLVERM